jgi:hypothetical protein
MRLSQLIANLTAQKTKLGDVNVVMSTGDDNNPSEADVDCYFAEEDDNWHERLILTPGETSNPTK